MARWYLNRGHGAEGPFDDAQVVRRIADGRFGPEWWAAREGAPRWQPLAAHPPFADALRGATTAPRPRAAPTLVGARAPTPTDGFAGVEHSLGGGTTQH